ncbi:RagB/SusD family nutrient uptake outer membrane protein [Aquimarina addita]|uniref:RagB/SusD family nutrient uptake outer membrane protein n=1 Tax=Aquimarina addita TaxID=870485 RepID=A0ABP6ULX8_9FLAO
METYIKYNRKPYIIFMLSLLVIGFTSCDLDVESESEVDSEVFYRDAEEVNLALISAYNSLRDVMDVEFSVTEIRSDNTFLSPDSSVENDVDNFTLDRGTMVSSNLTNEQYYRVCYSTIGLANDVIENVGNVEDLDLRNQYEAEARFLRAHCYFNLVRLYGAVIYVDGSLLGDDALLLERSPEAFVYQKIKEDLIYARENLPSEYGEDEVGRITQYAAKGILGKVYLTLGEYPLAITEFQDIIDSGRFGLVPNYADIFSTNNENNEEVIFAVQYISGNLGLGSPFANYFAPGATAELLGIIGDGDELNIPTSGIVDAYEDGDPRKEASLAESYTDSQGNEIFFNYITKYFTPVDNEFDSDKDWIILRYADIKLLLAEAYLEQGRKDEAVTLINEIRTRAGLANLTATDIASTFSTKLALERERRVEFAFENHRFFDLVRTGRALTVINQNFISEFIYNDPNNPQKAAAPISDYQLKLPIPQREIDINPNLAQNIGY